jgi:Tfp pilus assembly protein FimT
MILVIVVAGIIAVAVAARWPGMEITLQSYSNNLAADLDLARALALSRGESITIQHSSGATSYSITDSSGGSLYTTTPVDGVLIDSFTAVFDLYGSPGVADIDIGLSMNGSQITLRIVGESGAVVEL